MSIISWNKYIFVCGGANRFQVLTSVEKYSIENDSWTCMSPMKYRRYFFCVTALGKYIYAIGGAAVGTIVQSVRYIYFFIYSTIIKQ